MTSHYFRLEQQHPLLEPFPHIVEVGHESYDRVQFGSLTQHRNDGIEICLIEHGTFHWEAEGRTYRLLPGDVFLTLPWQVHGGINDYMDLGVLYWIVIKPERFDQSGSLHLGDWCALDTAEQHAAGNLLTAHATPLLSSDTQIAAHFRLLAAEIRDGCFGRRAKINALLTELLIQVIRRVQTMERSATVDRCRLDALKAVLLADPGKQWTLAEMAGLAERKITSFTSFIKNCTGLTPLDYLTNLRLDIAKELLLESNGRKIQDIAYSCGFGSPAHFSRVFKTRTGYTPSDYRLRNAVTVRE